MENTSGSEPMEDQYRIAFDEIPWTESGLGARSKVRRLGDRQLRLVEFGRDLVHPDWCITGHLGYVLEGEMEVEIDGGSLIFHAGDGIHFPPGEADRHRPIARSEIVRLVFVEDI